MELLKLIMKMEPYNLKIKQLDFFIALVLFLLLFWFGLRSTGTYQDDDMAHFMIAKYASRYPVLLLDIWGRPLFTMLYLPAAQWGLVGARLLSAAIAVATAWLTVLYARRAGLVWVPLVWVWVVFQPEFFLLSFSILTELLFALFLILAIRFVQQKRLGAATLLFALLPLVRYESAIWLFAWGLYLVYLRRWRLALLTVLPLLLFNGYWAIIRSDPAQLLFPFDRAVRGTSGFDYDYGRGDPLHYLRLLPIAIGLPLVALGALGLGRRLLRGLRLPHVVGLVLFGFYTTGFWLAPGIGMAGYVRHLAGLAPLVAILAAEGIEVLVRAEDVRTSEVVLTTLIAGSLGSVYWMIGQPRVATSCLIALAIFLALWIWSRRSPTVIRPAGVLASLGASVLTIVLLLVNIHPFRLSEEHLTIQTAAESFQSSDLNQHFTLGSNTWFAHFAGIDPFNPSRYGRLTPENLSAAAAGSIIVWDSHYSPRLYSQMPLEQLENSLCYERLDSFNSSDFSIHFFKKVSLQDCQE